jgi:hypothetical protein
MAVSEFMAGTAVINDEWLQHRLERLNELSEWVDSRPLL